MFFTIRLSTEQPEFRLMARQPNLRFTVLRLHVNHIHEEAVPTLDCGFSDDIDTKLLSQQSICIVAQEINEGFTLVQQRSLEEDNNLKALLQLGWRELYIRPDSFELQPGDYVDLLLELHSVTENPAPDQ